MKDSRYRLPSIAATLALAAALSGCALLPNVGRDAASIESTIESIDGIESASFTSTPDDDGRTESILTVHVADGWRIADTATLSDVLLRTAWTYEENPDSARIIVDGGVPENFDWFDSVVAGRQNERAFPYFTTYDDATNRSVIRLSGAAMDLLYGTPPIARPPIGDGMLEKGAVEAVLPSAVLSPRVTSAQNDEGVRYVAFSAYRNTLETTPYTGQVTVALLRDGTTLASGISDPGPGNTVRVKLATPLEGGVEYVVSISPSAQDGFDTAPRQYAFTQIG